MENYRIERSLGKGNTAEIFLVSDARDGRFYALKKFADTAKAVVKNEIRTLKTIKDFCSLHLLCFVDSFEEKKVSYIVMEYAPGYNLRDLRAIENGKYITRNFASSFLLQLTPALQILQNLNVAHCDIKPENIIYDPETDQFTIVDFGGSVVVKPERVYFNGTPGFMSENIMTKYSAESFHTVTIGDLLRNDVFALGATLFYILNGEYPFGLRKGRPKYNTTYGRMEQMDYAKPSKWTWSEDELVIKIVSAMLDGKYTAREILENFTLSNLLEYTPTSTGGCARLLEDWYVQWHGDVSEGLTVLRMFAALYGYDMKLFYEKESCDFYMHDYYTYIYEEVFVRHYLSEKIVHDKAMLDFAVHYAWFLWKTYEDKTIFLLVNAIMRYRHSSGAVVKGTHRF